MRLAFENRPPSGPPGGVEMKDTIKRIVAVLGVEPPRTVPVTWEDGQFFHVNLDTSVDRTPLSPGFRTPRFFANSRSGETAGESIGQEVMIWPLTRIILPNWPWGERRNHAARDVPGLACGPRTISGWAAQVLSLIRWTVAYYESGARIIPKLVRLAYTGRNRITGVVDISRA